MLHLAVAVDVPGSLLLVGAVAGVLLALAALFGALANHAHAQNNEALAGELQDAQEALVVAGKVGAAVAAGKGYAEAIVEAKATPEAQDLLQKFKVFAHLALALFLVSFLAACTSPAASVTSDRVTHLRQALADERQAEAIQAGSEDAVAKDRATVDADLAVLPLTADKVAEVEKALADERAHVAPRAGFEGAVAQVRLSVDHELTAIGSAVQ